MSSNIEYEFIDGPRGREKISVKLDGKVVGNIRASGDGYAYFPKGSRRGYAPEAFKTMREVQRSLEGDQQGRDR